MEEEIDRKLSKGLDNIQHINVEWDDFWIHVTKNNEKLRQYCEEGQYDEAKQLLLEGENHYPALVNYKALDDWTPLHYACY